MTLSRNDPSQTQQEHETLDRKEIDALRRAVNKVFTKGANESIQLTLQECKNIKGKRILDINCGAGYLAVQLAKLGAYVVGIDQSQKMIEAAKLTAEKEDLQYKCAFMKGDFRSLPIDGKFDISVALRFFDSIKNPTFNIKKMRAVTKEKCIMSFSAKFDFQTPLRMIWLRSRNTPSHFYTKKELKRLFEPHFSHYRIKNISAGYYCVGSVQNQLGNQH